MSNIGGIMGGLMNNRVRADIAGALDYREQKIRADEKRRKQIRAQQLAGEALSTGLREGSVLHRMASEDPDTYLLVAKATGIPANDGEQMDQYTKQLKYLSAMPPRQAFEEANRMVQKRQEMGLPPGPIVGLLESAMRDGPEVAYRGLQAQAQSIGADGLPAGVREFETMTRGLSPEEKEQARRVELGLAPRAGISANERIAQNTELTDRVAGSQSRIEGAKAGAKAQAVEGVKKESIKPKIRSSALASKAKADNVLEMIDNITPRISGLTAGFGGSLLSSIKGSEARDVQKDIETIKANIGFGELQEMRNNSPTGGALGQVSERELAYLQSVIANLDQDQSPEQLTKNLERVRNAVAESWRRVSDAYEQDYGEPLFEEEEQQPAQQQPQQQGGIKFLGFE